MNWETLLPHGIFYILAFGLVTFATLVISSHHTLHSIFYLIGTFFQGAGLMLLLGADFISFIILIVYIGAVAVLFLFVVMMLHFSQEKALWKRPLTYCGTILMTEFVLFLILNWWHPFYGAGFKFSPIKDKVLYPFTTPLMNFTAQDIGRVLYTDYFIAFQIIGLILFTATVGALLLTLRHRRQGHRQDIAVQIDRSPETTLELKDIPKAGTHDSHH